MIYYPDYYTILLFKDIETEEDEIKIFAGFYGGYSQGDSWKLSSGTTSIEEITLENNCTDVKEYEFKQYSGSSYVLSQNEGKHTSWIQSILDRIMQEYSRFKVITIEEAINIMKEVNKGENNV